MKPLVPIYYLIIYRKGGRSVKELFTANKRTHNKESPPKNEDFNELNEKD
jgi:hypothetical protein